MSSISSHRKKTSPWRNDPYSNRIIKLTQCDPIARLEELCMQSLFTHRMFWVRFGNCTFIKCVLYQETPSTRFKLHEVCHFAETHDLNKAKGIIAAKLIFELGLSNHDDIPIFDEEEPSPSSSSSPGGIDINSKNIISLLSLIGSPALARENLGHVYDVLEEELTKEHTNNKSF